MTVVEAAEILGLTPRDIQWRIKEGKIKARRVGKRLLMIPRAEVDRELSEREGKPKAGRPPAARRQPPPEGPTDATP